MGVANEEAIKQFQSLMEQVDEPLKNTFKNMHRGYPIETLVRFLKARDRSVAKAHKMLIDCLQWRIQNEIDHILAGLPVIAIGVGLSTFDKASVHYYVQSHIQMNEYRDCIILPSATKKHGRHIDTCLKVLDMTGLKLSALNQIKLLSAISTIDDLNYPEKTETYYIVNVPYVFSACWKVVKPLLQERTRRKIQVLQGCGTDELLKIMDYGSLPHFCRKEGSGSSRHYGNGNADDCFSLDHAFHQQLSNYIKQQALLMKPNPLTKQGSVRVDVPEPSLDDAKIAKTIETEFHRFENQNGLKVTSD
ncbi:phosphatidylinositol/phosphatidylcholine transfer protein SFH8-like isoform X2 [Juglans microcarpa x Juglans regia]|uniref:phosphatidylinositol/phosphatidylcholine transfer protein SFH8-like isoform X2 n=1 Tax=Juglans microcarpa x Juglans regia TaxID=2249226 RepID=UPI001B7EADE1|nr:phosphatidylinositol/phosphatidylcholine transfer protein SFH8-like isoform X2 [Juglans microcarpa x Juglans regia]